MRPWNPSVEPAGLADSLARVARSVIGSFDGQQG
jgi:hypothetical protein